MRNISQEKLYEIRLPVAPIEKQKAFARLMESMNFIVEQHAPAFQRAEATFRALLANAFAEGGPQGTKRKAERMAVA